MKNIIFRDGKFSVVEKAIRNEVMENWPCDMCRKPVSKGDILRIIPGDPYEDTVICVNCIPRFIEELRKAIAL